MTPKDTECTLYLKIKTVEMSLYNYVNSEFLSFKPLIKKQ